MIARRFSLLGGTISLLALLALLASTGWQTAIAQRPEVELLGTIVASASCEEPPQDYDDHTETEIDRAIARGLKFLESRQSGDGAWRSNVYGPFKQGESLTPPVLLAWQRGGGKLNAAYGFVTSLAPDAAGELPDGVQLTYPVYAAACAVLARPDQPERAEWIQLLRSRQLTEPLGYSPADPQYGGWCYAQGLANKPPVGSIASPLLDPNLSATVYALMALRVGGASDDDPAIVVARRFVERQQNFAMGPRSSQVQSTAGQASSGTRELRLDGGFHFLAGDPVRNKAGIAAHDTAGEPIFASYGSATADGLHALVLCGLTPKDPRVTAALQWLSDNFSATEHPGKFAADRATARDGLYFYYAASLAETLAELKVPQLTTGPHRIDWAAELSVELRERQHADGSWANDQVAQREDDPLVATAFAIRALAACQGILKK